MKKIRILSIDGGGIRGILPGTILTYLEKILQQMDGSTRKIGDYFDLIAGTSTGGILSCIYLLPGPDGNARFTAEEALDIYIKNGHTIFDRTLAQKVSSLGGIAHEKYSDHPIYGLLDKYCGETTLDQLIKPCLITSYEITDRKAMFFTSADAVDGPLWNFKVKDVARATSAAPTYFQPAHIQSLNGQVFALVDGGVFANNPALCAYAEARTTNFSKALKDKDKIDSPTAKDMIIVSIGTGSVKKQYHYDKFKHAGEIEWLEPLIDILMSANSETVDYQLMQMYKTLDDQEDRSHYFRLEPGLKEACSEMDIATPENVENLHQAGLSYVKNNIELLNTIAKVVLENG